MSAAGAGWELWAGSDGAGVVYKISPVEAGAKPFAVYAAARKEITALAMDAAGNVYAAGVGTKGARGAAAVAGDGECGGDDYVFAAGVGDVRRGRIRWCRMGRRFIGLGRMVLRASC